MADVIKDFWGLILSAVALVAWLVRLEARGIANAAEVRRLWSQRKEDLDASKESRASVEKKIDDLTSLIRDQGNDIKQLIREGKR